MKLLNIFYSQIARLKNSKLGWITIMIISIGTTIGAGIFFKNKSIFDNAHHYLSIAILSWVVSGIGMIAIGLALIELSTSNKHTSDGVIAWTNTYSSKWFKKSARGFMYWIYLPLNFFAMPLYAMMSIQDATGWFPEWYVVAFLAMSISLFFMILSGLSTKIGAGFQWTITLTKLLPILVVIIFGFKSNEPTLLEQTNVALGTGSELTSKAAMLGIFASMPAILFAFDGFYMSSSLSKDMKKPSKLPLAIFMSVVVITGIYVLITAAIGDRDDLFGIGMSDKWLKITNIGIAIAILGIINGFALGTTKMINYAIDEKHIWGYHLYKKMGKHAGLIWMIVVTIFSFLVFVPIGVTVFKNNSYVGDYGIQIEQLYSLVDLLTNWTSLLVFVFIVSAIFGAFREFHKSKILKSKGWIFKISSWVSIIFVLLATIYQLVDSLFTIIIDPNLGNTMVLVILITIVILSVVIELPIKEINTKIVT